MTISKFSTDYLVNNGFFPDQAERVFEQVKQDKSNEAMTNRWNDEVDGYPKSMQSVLIYTLNRNAVEWIDANCPQAWFREIFAS
jgi:hypothetical protein